MNNIAKKPYEISLWKEKLVFLVKYYNSEDNCIKEKKYYGSLENFEEVSGAVRNEIFQYYEEEKMFVIGSNTMEAPVRAIQPKFVSNVNGSNTLTFSMYSKYWDNELKQFCDNPFLKYLVNERKIKLREGAIDSEDCKWYDLVIKNIQEDSESKLFTYTAKDLFINELSKSGFEVVLDPKLENSTDNIVNLGNKVLEGSDWKIGSDNSILEQFKEEPLYLITLNCPLRITDMKTNEQITLEAGLRFYGFYGPISNQDAYFQLLYVENEDYKKNSDLVIINSKNWYVEGVEYLNGRPVFAKEMTLSSDYRGKRLIRQAKPIYDKTIDKYVYSYSYQGKEYYGFTETEYVSPITVQNFITSPNAFINLNGWAVGIEHDGDSNESSFPSLELSTYPELQNITNDGNFISLLKYKTENGNQVLFNSGIKDNQSLIKGISEGDKFVFRIKCATKEHENLVYEKGKEGLADIKIGTYTLNESKYNITKSFTQEGESYYKDEYVWFIFKSDMAYSYSEMLNKNFGIFIQFLEGEYYIEDVQFFRYITYKDDEENIAIAVPNGEIRSSVRTKYNYYVPDLSYKNLDDVKFYYQGYSPIIGMTQNYGKNQFEKIRTITAKESNRFNLIQTLCESFECWPRFEIEHEKDGRIKLDESDGYRQKKWVTFHEYVGIENCAGFKYGVNLKSIQRTLDSAGTVSKLIVKDNDNEFGEDGFCSISRASENVTGENFIYDFSYYVQQKLIDFNEINNDLYLDSSGYLGYYKKLKELNKNKEAWIQEQSELQVNLSNLSSSYQTYKLSVESAEEELRAIKAWIQEFTGYSYEYLVEQKDISSEVKNWWNNNDLIAKINRLAQLKNIITRHSTLMSVFKSNYDDAQLRLNTLKEALTNLASTKKELNLRFYKKYSRFIQEGSWIKQDYIDDNLYYLDAESVLHTSSQPKVSYNIGVLELSQIEEYKNYKFNLGDITYIEDTEFFGWEIDQATSIKSPYKEEIVVTEITRNLDSPELNSIKVQNYKTQFEDLFQRITATTQSIEYHTGEYARAANIVEAGGTIVAETLQNSIANNAIRLENVKDQSVVWDETGITSTCLARPNEMIRMISGGIFMSIDGGITWSTGLTGSGINATYITSGYLNTGAIHIMNGSNPSFRWDGYGLNAYEFTVINEVPSNFITSNFVRFDQYGIYGIKGKSDFKPSSIDEVWNNATYALTWKGFRLSNNDGSVEISSEDDIRVLEGSIERIKIGRLDDSLYGIRISDNSGETVMETDSEGELWLRNRLRVGTGETSTVSIGYLSDFKELNNNKFHQVINANDKFIVYEDGSMTATEAVFSGVIKGDTIFGENADSLTAQKIIEGINNLDNIVAQVKGIKIVPTRGTDFKVSNDSPSPEELSFRIEFVGFENSNLLVKWSYSVDFEKWQDIIDQVDENSYTLTYEKFNQYSNNGSLFIKATVQEGDKKYEAWEAITATYLDLDSSSYLIETNVEDITYVQNTNLEYSYSPEVLTFAVYNLNNLLEKIDLEGKYKLEFLGENGYEQVISNIEYNEDNKLVSFQVNNFYSSITATSKPSVFRFSYNENNKTKAVKFVFAREALSNELLNFTQTAQSIGAAVGAGKISFDTSGLTIYKIEEKDNETIQTPVFYATTDSGDIYVKGIIEASGGSFSGKITATSGTIGGLTIEGNQILGDKLTINSDGSIKANEIALGEAATIESFIKIGNAFIKNPEKYDKLFIEAGKFYLYENGKLKLGAITLYGGDGTPGSAYLTSNESVQGLQPHWKICDDGTANFREITVDKATIQNSIMEIGKIQAVGSIQIFNDSWKILNVQKEGESFKIELDVTLFDDNGNPVINLKEGDYVLLNGNTYHKVDNINIDNKQDGTKYATAIFKTETFSGQKGDIIVKIGAENEHLITMQGDSSKKVEYANTNSLTISKIIKNANDDKLPMYATNLVLGDLSAVGKEGFGLYGNNVYLEGSLTAKQNGYYSGINTLNSINSIKIENNPEIIIWAGATSSKKDGEIEEDDIKNAPFQVTRDGSIYANKGIFEGAIISDSVIEGAVLRAAKIYGTNNNEGEPSLKLYDAQKGIQFIKTTADDNEIIQFSIDVDGLYTGNNNEYGLFVDLREGQVKYYGSEAQYTLNNEKLILQPNTIAFQTRFGESRISPLGQGMVFESNGNTLLSAFEDTTRFPQDVEILNNLIVGRDGAKGTLNYRQSEDGYYDLYVI